MKVQPSKENIDLDFRFDYEVEFPEDVNNKFVVVIQAILKSKDYQLETIFLSEFKVDGTTDNNFKKNYESSRFLRTQRRKINGRIYGRFSKTRSL